MSEIIYGLYEQIINGIITENLNKVDQILSRSNIDIQYDRLYYKNMARRKSADLEQTKLSPLQVYLKVLSIITLPARKSSL